VAALRRVGRRGRTPGACAADDVAPCWSRTRGRKPRSWRTWGRIRSMTVPASSSRSQRAMRCTTCLTLPDLFRLSVEGLWYPPVSAAVVTQL